MLCSTGTESTPDETDNDEYGVRPEDLDTEPWVATTCEDELGLPELDTKRMEWFLGADRGPREKVRTLLETFMGWLYRSLETDKGPRYTLVVLKIVSGDSGGETRWTSKFTANAFSPLPKHVIVISRD